MPITSLTSLDPVIDSRSQFFDHTPHTTPNCLAWLKNPLSVPLGIVGNSILWSVHEGRLVLDPGAWDLEDQDPRCSWGLIPSFVRWSSFLHVEQGWLGRANRRAEVLC